MTQQTLGFTLSDWQQAYQQEGLAPAAVLGALRNELSTDDNAWISLASEAQLNEQLAALDERLQQVEGNVASLPLYGVPFAVKDNIDAAGWDTTAACPAFAHQASADATVVARLRAA